MNFGQKEECYYDILGVSKDSDQKTIKKAWHAKSLIWHPDKLPDSEKESGKDMMQKINEAYAVLSDPQKRAMYDKFGKAGQDGGVDLGSFFKNFGGFGGFQNFRYEIQPIKITIPMKLEDIYNGKKIAVSFQRKNFCKTCNGTSTNKNICNNCRGTFFVNEMFKFEHTIPPGYCDGDNIVVNGVGNEGHPSHCKERGKVVLIVKELKHPTFLRPTSGDRDLLMVLNITLSESLCGFTKTFKHLDGRNLTIVEKGITDPTKFKIIKFEGLPRKISPNTRGNLLVRFNIAYPKNLSIEQQRSLFSVLNPNKTMKNIDYEAINNKVTLNDITEDDLNNNSMNPEEDEGPAVGCSQQ